MQKNKLFSKEALVFVIISQILNFIFPILLPGYPIITILPLIGFIIFPFFTKGFKNKLIFSTIYFFTIPIVLLIVFIGLYSFVINNLFNDFLWSIIEFILQIIFWISLIIAINSAFNLLFIKLYCRFRLSDKNERKISKLLIYLTILIIVFYTSLSLSSQVCTKKTGNFFLYNQEKCSCDGIKLPSIFKSNSCIGQCIDCKCGVYGKEFKDYDCSKFPNYGNSSNVNETFFDKYVNSFLSFD